MKEIKVVNKTVNEYWRALEIFTTRVKRTSNDFMGEVMSAMGKSGRAMELVPPPGKNIVMTTYFTSKVDPQRNVKVEPGQIEYIRTWYESLVAQGLKGVVFVDFTDPDFFARFANENVIFVRCKLGERSVNDERYFFFQLYALCYFDELNRVFLTDGNDVTILRSPFEFVDSCHKATLFVGRNNTSKIMYSEINKRRLNYLENQFRVRIPGSFYLQPVYNAGIIGGNINVVLYFLTCMCGLMDKYPSPQNLNMIFLNMVIYQFFCPHVAIGLIDRYLLVHLPYKGIEFIEKTKMALSGKSWNEMKGFDHMRDLKGNGKTIRTSYPLHNAYKSYETIGNEFLMHK